MKIENLTKKYNDQLVLDHINMEFEDGKKYGLMGPSGSGKTTLLHIILGLEKADDGTVSGLEQKKAAAVFQEDRLCEAFSALENVAMVTNELSKEQIREELSQLLPMDSIDKPVKNLSGGMKRRVAVCRSLLAPSDMIIMDEPFTGLDENTKKAVIQYIVKKTKGKMLIISTHNEEDIAALGGELIKLDGYC